MSDVLLRTEVDVELRAIDESKRQATFVCSTERAVPMWDGPEVLRSSGVDLRRFKRNPVLLDSHDRSTIEAVLGSSVITVEGRKLVATNTYATTPRGEIAWQLVRGGHVRAMSIGYQVDPAKVKRLAQGEIDGREEDGSLVTGPATVVNRWTLLEVSNVPVPADQDAVRRAFYDKECPVATSNTLTAAMSAALASAPPAGQRAEGATPPAPHTVPAPAQVPSPPATAPAPDVRALEAHRRDVLAITPPGLEREAHELILRGGTLEEARAALIAAQAKRFAPIGTPEPQAPGVPAPGQRAEADVSDDDLVRSFASLS
jgi:phage head maturation protease